MDFMGSNSTTYLGRTIYVHKVKNLSICTLHAKSVPYILFSPKLVFAHNTSPEKQISLKVNCWATTSHFTAETAALKPLGLFPWRQAAQGRFPARKGTQDSEISLRIMCHDLQGPVQLWDAQCLVLVRSQVQHFWRCTGQLALGLLRKVLGSTLDIRNDFIDQLISTIRGRFSTRWYHRASGLCGSGMPDANAAGASTPISTSWFEEP